MSEPFWWQLLLILRSEYGYEPFTSRDIADLLIENGMEFDEHRDAVKYASAYIGKFVSWGYAQRLTHADGSPDVEHTGNTKEVLRLGSDGEQHLFSRKTWTRRYGLTPKGMERLEPGGRMVYKKANRRKS